MKLRLITEKTNTFFDYDCISKELWNEKLKDAKNETNISFDTENDEDISQRTIKIDEYSFKCELRKAGGDWEFPIIYFRCQLIKGYISKLVYRDSYFCYIPSKADGNSLVKTDSGWSALNNDENDKIESNDNKCWHALKRYLKKLAI